MSFEPIAVVGRACVLPGALTPQALWDNVREGRDLVGAVPEGRWRLASARVLGEGPDRAWTERGGYVTGFDEVFDSSGFLIARELVQGLDPLFQWLLHVSREALREARAEKAPRTGAVFGNLSFPSASAARFAERAWLGDELAEAALIARTDARNRFSSGLPAHLVAQALGVTQGAFCIDAACASSLYAIKLACDRLHDRSADLMLAGAVNCADDLFIHVGFCALQAMSRTGRSRPFHRQADGLVPAEGAGAVVLKRLADARGDGDRIFGVLRGVGLSNDGRGSGLLAPSEEGQVRAMRAAYQEAGLSPSDISLVECHATGTAVGDRTEIRSLRRVFEDVRGLPLGSLKSNLGHAITAAGVAGLIKLLGALEHRERPPTLHADEPLDELSRSPFRLLERAEPWECAGIRRAALNAFGFGGCNAHLIIEEPTSRAASLPTGPLLDQREVAIVGIGACVGSGTSTPHFEEALFAADGREDRTATKLALGVAATRFPPRDLELTLPQQVWLLAAAQEALLDLKLPRRDRVGVFVGVGSDPLVARYGARWRMREWAEAWEVDEPEWIRRAEDALAPPLEAAGVLGTLPNLPANRLSFQHDFAGPGFTVSAEELSGVRALQIAERALGHRELDLAIVGASDFSCEPAHEAALRALGDLKPAGDAAIVLALERVEDARREGHRILAVIEEAGEGASVASDELHKRFGSAHASSGLLQVAAAALACARGRRIGGERWAGPRRAQLEIEALGGQKAIVALRSESEAVVEPAAAVKSHGAMHEYQAHWQPVRLPPLGEIESVRSQWLRLRAADPGPQRMAPAPALAAILDQAPQASVALPSPQKASGIAAQQGMFARAHSEFVESQALAHRLFLETRERINEQFLQRARGLQPAFSPTSPDPESTRPGLKLDRRGLEIHAAGRISEVYGSLFAQQDGHRRQVRMPEPPLLLADRLVGLEAEAGSMGKGRLWTETDIAGDAWYLHDARMPAGILIEAGQADLMLISYLGVDFLNRGERVYRLLGCDLTFHGGLPEPGETLRYEIRVDGHASQGPVRLFFFQYDCKSDQPRLTVRNGQAGFFTDEELAHSAGVLWDAASAEHRPDARVAPPRAQSRRARFDRAMLQAFAAGDLLGCFGEGFELGCTHTRSPRISDGRMLLLEEVSELSPTGGPWGRGYLRAVDRVSPDDWFFQGHFKNDPCMPGTLMFEGCLQAMSLYLAGLGFTLERDGWRFEPVPDETYRLRCRGQATPASKEIVYEVFVEGLDAGPEPTLWADLLVTVDGLKAFHCRRMGLRLVPGWPLDSKPRLTTLADPKPAAQAKGFSFGDRSVLACAWGRPSQAFGEMYRVFDGPRRVPRLPGPPYLLVSRIKRILEGEPGAMQVGSAIEAEYDIPPDAWYFDANGAQVMPFAVLLEVALQPCGWLASFAGCALATEKDLFFRNLDGTGTLRAEVRPDAGTLITRVKLTQISRSAGMIIVGFEVTCSTSRDVIYELKTVFGFFPKEALEAQRGLPFPESERDALTAGCDESIDLREGPARFFGSGSRLASSQLCMLHRVTGVWPEGGPAGLGRFRAELDVDPTAWSFKAHFFQDPVQPGSLGLEAMLQLLQVAMIRLGLAEGADRFEPIAVGLPHSWKFRGQVVPTNRLVTVLLGLTRVERQERAAFGDASLWVDGLRIYEARGLAMRAVREPDAEIEVLAPSTHPWLKDHCPTFTVPALPLMSMVDRLAAAVARKSRAKVIAVEDAQVHRWLPIAGAVRLKTEVVQCGARSWDATLLSWREASRAELSRFEPVATARVSVGDEWPPAEEMPWAPPSDARPVPDPYQSGDLFHGPSLQVLRKLARGASGATALLRASATGAPHGLLNEALLDGLTHSIPHDSLAQWSASIEPGFVAYPSRVVSLRVYAQLPREGEVRCETRFAGFEGEDPRRPRCRVQAIVGDRVVAALDLVETLFPKGPLGCAPPCERRAFLRDRTFVAGLRLSDERDGVTVLPEESVRQSDWLPGTVAHAFATRSADPVSEIAAKEHVAARACVHPATVEIRDGSAHCQYEPLNTWPLQIEREASFARVRETGPVQLDLKPVREYWDRHFGIGRWPVEDLFYSLAQRFLRRVRVEPETLDALRGRGVLYLANHQVAVESLLFSVVLSGLTGVPTVTLAKAEHRQSWLGLLIKHAFSYPGVTDPGVITFFDRGAQGELPKVVHELAGELKGGKKSVMVHVEGTRALRSRAKVEKMSGAFLDMAVATGTPVVPVRFAGGLPIELVSTRLEFPVGMCRQDFIVGRPIAPGELVSLSYKARKERVLAAINALMPEQESPGEADPILAAEVGAWAAKTGASHEHSVLFQALRSWPAPCGQTQKLLEALERGQLPTGSSPANLWLVELARRLSSRVCDILPS